MEFISDQGQADINARSPDNLRQDKNPERDFKHQKRKQTYGYDTNQSTAVISSYRFTAVERDARKPEDISETK